MGKFKLGQRAMYKHREVKIIGIDTEIDGVYPYFCAFTDRVVNSSSVNQCSTMSFVKEKTKNFNSFLECEYDWLCDEDLRKITAETVAEKPAIFVRRFKSGAVRSDDRGRENPAFISPYALKFLAEHFSANAAFFNNSDSAKNYMKGIEPIDIEGSLARHYIDFGLAMMPNRRENVGPIKKALVEIMANCVMGLHQIGMAENGEYVELFTKTEYIKKED